MKLSEVMGLKRYDDFYEYDNKLLKLFSPQNGKETVYKEFDNNQSIAKVYKNILKGYGVIDVEDQLGIIYEKINGHSMLFEMETYPSKLTSFAEQFSRIHKEMTNIDIESVQSQKEYYQNILKEATIEKHIKTELETFLDSEGQHSKLCHGNFQPDKVVLFDEAFKIIDFEKAYRGNPLSDIAKTLIILESPRHPVDASELLIELLEESRKVFQEIYASHFDLNHQSFNNYYRLAALSRLNEHIKEEHDWLMSIINGA